MYTAPSKSTINWTDAGGHSSMNGLRKPFQRTAWDKSWFWEEKFTIDNLVEDLRRTGLTTAGCAWLRGETGVSLQLKRKALNYQEYLSQYHSLPYHHLVQRRHMRANIAQVTKSWLTFLKCLSVILNGKSLTKRLWFRFYLLKTDTNLSVSNFMLENQYLKTDLQSSGFKQTLKPGWGLLSREQQTETTDTKSLTPPTTIFLKKIKNSTSSHMCLHSEIEQLKWVH